MKNLFCNAKANIPFQAPGIPPNYGVMLSLLLIHCISEKFLLKIENAGYKTAWVSTYPIWGTGIPYVQISEPTPKRELLYLSSRTLKITSFQIEILSNSFFYFLKYRKITFSVIIFSNIYKIN